MKTAKEILEIKKQAIQKEVNRAKENTERLVQSIGQALEEQAQNKQALVTTLFVEINVEHNYSFMYNYINISGKGYMRQTNQYDFDTLKKILSDGGYCLTIDRDSLNNGAISCKRLTISIDEKNEAF